MEGNNKQTKNYSDQIIVKKHSKTYIILKKMNTLSTYDTSEFI